MSLKKAVVFTKSGKELRFEPKEGDRLFADQQGHYVSVGIRDSENVWHELAIIPMKSIDFVMKHH